MPVTTAKDLIYPYLLSQKILFFHFLVSMFNIPLPPILLELPQRPSEATGLNDKATASIFTLRVAPSSSRKHSVLGSEEGLNVFGGTKAAVFAAL